MTHRTIGLKTEVTGHLTRAQKRVERAMKGTSTEDVVIQAAVCAVGTALALRLLRLAPISKLVESVAPMAIFAALWTRASGPTRASR